MATPSPSSFDNIGLTWLGDPHWLAMDATARGFHAQLTLIAARQTPTGTLPDDDAQWRRWLGLPPPWIDDPAAADDPNASPHAALRRFFAAPDRKGWGVTGALLESLATVWAPTPDAQAASVARAGYERWVDHLWRTRWKPMVLAAWTRLPSSSSSKSGERWWNPVAAALGQSTAPSAAAPTSAVAARPTRRRAHEALPALNDPVWAQGDVAPLGLPCVTVDTSAWRDPAKIARHWKAPLASEQRRSMWDLGVSLLSHDHYNQAAARAFLGRLIRDHGEQAVSHALADLSRRQLPPADAHAFLTKILQHAQTGGSPAEQRAREQRVRVAL